jgi:zinc protease
MRKLLTGLFLLASVLGAQTEVRRAIALPSYKDLKFPPLPPLKIPEPVTFTLPDGIRVYLLEDHELPVISGSALIRTGNLFDPADKKGLAQVTGDVLRSGGTKAKTGDEIDVELENIAASVESGIGESSGSLSFSALRENTDQVLGAFHDVLTSPEFRQDKIDLEKTQMRSSISRRNDDANGIVGREFDDILYGRNTPYGWTIEYKDVDNIQRADLVNFYKRYYFPANTMLAIYGDFSAAEMRTKLERLFADWTVTQPAVPKFPEVQKTAAPGVFLATKTDITQTFFEVGHLGGEYRDKDYPALEVTSEILGGGFSSRLFQRIRTKLGYAYNISASWGAGFDHPGLFEISGSTQSAHTVDTMRAIREEVEKMRTSEVGDAELQTAKDTVLNGFVFRFDRPSKTLFRLVTYDYYGYPKDFIFQYQKAIAKVTKEDVLRVAKEYFRPQDLTFVAVGNPKEFKVPISELGLTVKPIDLTIPQPPKPAAKVDPASAQRGKEMLDKMQAALGGAAKLESVKDVQYHAEVAIQAGGAGMKAKQTNSFVKPATMRQDIELPFAKQSVFFGGESGWLATPQGTQNLPGPVVKQIQGELFRAIFSLALSDRDPSRTISAVDGNIIAISDKQGDSVQIQVDAGGLPAKMMYSGDAMGGATPSPVEEDLSDWRDVNGLKLPFATTIVQNGKKFAEVKVQDYKINSGITTEELSKKP